MRLSGAAVLWVGTPTCFARVSGGLLGPRGTSLEMCAVDPVTSSGDGWQELVPWLAHVCATGETVHVLHQNHVLRFVELPRAGEADLAKAVHARIEAGLLLSAEERVELTVEAVAGGKPRAVWAAIPRALESGVGQALEAAGLRLGRVGFAGQLAALLLFGRCPAGGWTVLADMACSQLLVLACASGGRAATVGLPADEPDPIAKSSAHLARWLGESTPLPAPVDLNDGAGPRARMADGSPAPAPLAYLLPAFLRRRRWTVPSRLDLDYPYHFARTTWAFGLILVAMLLYGGHLVERLGDLRASAAEFDRARRELVGIERQEREFGKQLAEMGALEQHLRGVKAEAFDNGAWLHYVAAVRDRYAAGLVFDSLRVGAPELELTGAHPVPGPVLELFGRLARALGAERLKLAWFERLSDGGVRFTLTIVRGTSTPPLVLATEW